VKDTVKQYFENYPESDSCHETSDGFLFHKLNDAECHGNSLKEKEVVSHARVESLKLKVESEPASEAELATEETLEPSSEVESEEVVSDQLSVNSEETLESEAKVVVKKGTKPKTA